MQIFDGRVLLSPSDLNDYINCRHLTTLAREVARGDRDAPHTADKGAQRGPAGELEGKGKGGPVHVMAPASQSHAARAPRARSLPAGSGKTRARSCRRFS